MCELRPVWREHIFRISLKPEVIRNETVSGGMSEIEQNTHTETHTDTLKRVFTERTDSWAFRKRLVHGPPSPFTLRHTCVRTHTRLVRPRKRLPLRSVAYVCSLQITHGELSGRGDRGGGGGGGGERRGSSWRRERRLSESRGEFYYPAHALRLLCMIM